MKSLQSKNNHFNPFRQCRKYRIPLRQCPSFLFSIIGLINVFTILTAYFVAYRWLSTQLILSLLIGITTALMIIGYAVSRGFEELVRANRIKSEFISIVSHRLRTPLVNIKWSLNLLLDKESKNIQQKEYLKLIKENNELMIKLINDLLIVSRIEENHLVLKPKKISLNSIIHQVIKEIKPSIDKQKVKIQLNFDPCQSYSVMADPEKIFLVVKNIIDNALRYIGKIKKIEVKLSQNDKKVRCEIIDKGVGIPKEDQKFIFQKFFRANNIRKYQTQGTGLGLFIAQAIIKASQGKIGFDSQENKGSNFWFELPSA